LTIIRKGKKIALDGGQNHS